MSDLYNTGVRKLIDDYLVEESKKERNYGDYWSASSAGYCMRKLTFERLGVPKTKEQDPRTQRVFSAGHLFHEWLQRLTKEAGVSVAQELELQDESLMVRGHFDDLIQVDKSLILYDYKTASSKSFAYKRDVSHFHRMQVGTYLYMLRKQKEYKGLTESRILVLEKDTLRTKEFQVMWDKELALDVHNFWTELNEYWNKVEIPPCTCADYEGGFMAKEQYNDFYYNGAPCSLDWFELWQENKKNEAVQA
jgi:hypothetical protein